MQQIYCLEDFGIKPMEFTEIMDAVFDNKPKEYLKQFFENEVIQYLWWNEQFHGGKDYLHS